MTIRKAVALLAGFALAVGLLGSGVGAQFTGSAIAQENINVGTFRCGIVDATAGAQIAGDGSWVLYTAPDIMSSAAGSAPFSFTVKSFGSIPARVSVAQTTAPASPFTSLPIAPAAAVVLTQNETQVYTAGLQWPELDNSNLGQSVSVVYTVSCIDLGGAAAFDVGYYVVNDGGAQFAPGTWVRSTTPIPSTALVTTGTATQSINAAGSLNLTITNDNGYADNGFYVPLGTLNSLAASGYTVTGTGSQFGTNVYFDVDNNGEFFGWTGNYLSSIAPDTYGLGPVSVAGTLTVTGGSLFQMTCNGLYGSYSLTTLATIGCTEGVSGSTHVAVWVGITHGSGDLNTTIISAP